MVWAVGIAKLLNGANMDMFAVVKQLVSTSCCPLCPTESDDTVTLTLVFEAVDPQVFCAMPETVTAFGGTDEVRDRLVKLPCPVDVDNAVADGTVTSFPLT